SVERFSRDTFFLPPPSNPRRLKYPFFPRRSTMKNKFWLAGLMALTLATGTVLTLHAEEGAPGEGQDHPSMDQGGKGGEMERMKRKLGLSDDQAAQLKALYKKYAEANKPLR